MAGRPKRVFTEQQKAEIEQMALDNCHIDTIGMALGIAKNTLIRHYGTFIKQKRAEGRVGLRRKQCKLADNNPAMAIFLGKNELDQTDKQIIVDETQVKELTETEQAEARRLANLRLRQGA